MKNLKYILILLLLVPFSCIDDKSKFSDTEIDEIEIAGIEKSRGNRGRFQVGNFSGSDH